jgi:hypothetical protein
VLLLLELILELGWDRRHRWSASLEALLRLSWTLEACILGLQLRGRLRRLHSSRLALEPRITRILLLQRRLSEARWLRSERARLLLTRLLARG